MTSTRFVAINSGSTSTSTPWLVADYTGITVSWQSSASLGPSRFTIEVSNADGLQASDLGGATSTLNWSLFSGVNMIGRPTAAFVLDATGFRWMRVSVPPANHSAASAVAIIMNGQSW